MREIDEQQLLDAARYLRGSWKSTHRATGDLCAEAACTIKHLRERVKFMELMRSALQTIADHYEGERGEYNYQSKVARQALGDECQ